MSRTTLTVAFLLFAAPFLLLAAGYAALPPELPALRSPFTGAAAVAPKSLFMVFRVPAMNLIHGLMAVLMLSHAADFLDDTRRTAYSNTFLTLLLAIACKSNFEALELSGLLQQPGSRLIPSLLTAGTVLSVVGGLAIAIIRSRRVPLPWRELRLTARDKCSLAVLFLIYLGMVAATARIALRA
ncbi:MAG: hypothetical protein J0H49_27830 [Acidobacteria bacterium]|nr:hypothetical protein [Acidobacteriota bacterium]